MLLVEPLDEVKLSSLFLQGQIRIDHVFNQFVDRFVIGIDVGPLVDSWQKPRLPILRLLDR